MPEQEDKSTATDILNLAQNKSEPFLHIGASQGLIADFLSITMSDGKPGIRITRDMAMGKFEISDELILELARKNPRLGAALVGLTGFPPGDVLIGNFRKTINVLLNEFVNELHMYMADRISPGWVEQNKTQDATG
jgi:hypothetical protein